MDQSDANLRNMLQLGIKAAQAKRKTEAYQLLSQVVRRDPQNEQGWLWLAAVAPTPQESLDAFERVLAINPGNEQARVGQRWAASRLANAPAAAGVSGAAAAAPGRTTPPPVTAPLPKLPDIIAQATAAGAPPAPASPPAPPPAAPGTDYAAGPGAPAPASSPAGRAPAAPLGGAPLASDWRAAGDLSVGVGGLNWDDNGSDLSSLNDLDATLSRGRICPNCGAPGQTGAVCSLCDTPLPPSGADTSLDPSLRGAVFTPASARGAAPAGAPPLVEPSPGYAAPVAAGAVPAAPYVDAIRPVGRRSNPLVLLLGVGLFVVGLLAIGLGTGIIGGTANRFDAAGQQFFQRHLQKDYPGAGSLLQGNLQNTYKASHDLPDLNLAATLGSLTNPVVQPAAPLAVAPDNSAGESIVTITSTGGAPLRYLVHLMHSGDQWKIDQILPAP
ncbi:MAG TPA: hypothetical protein VKY74_04715 [Chloroflexia bacterium]|nr:hypothetical protein [Chloroflexia bacterium]